MKIIEILPPLLSFVLPALTYFSLAKRFQIERTKENGGSNIISSLQIIQEKYLVDDRKNLAH